MRGCIVVLPSSLNIGHMCPGQSSRRQFFNLPVGSQEEKNLETDFRMLLFVNRSIKKLFVIMKVSQCLPYLPGISHLLKSQKYFFQTLMVSEFMSSLWIQSATWYANGWIYFWKIIHFSRENNFFCPYVYPPLIQLQSYRGRGCKNSLIFLFANIFKAINR